MNENDTSHTTPTACRTERLRALGKVDTPLVRYLRARLGSLEEARDCAQETYARVLSSNDPEAIVDVTQFTWKVAKNLATDWLIERSCHRRLREKFSIEFETEEHRSPERACVEQTDTDALIRVIATLPRRVRIVFEAYMDDETPNAIAARYDIPLRTVYRDLDRARAHVTNVLRMRERGGRP